MGKQFGLGCWRLCKACIVTAVLFVGTTSIYGEEEIPCPTKPASDEPADSCFSTVLEDQECGISIDPVYYGEVFTNTKGGISTNDATQYQALLDLPITIDFNKMNTPLPGKFFLRAQNTHGRGITEDFVGDTFVVSNIDSFNNITQMTEYWWEIPLFEDTVALRLGKQDVNTEFLVMDSAADFIQSSFGLSPSASLSSYPDTSMAAVIFVQLTESVQLKGGLWDAKGDGGTWGFSGNEVTSSIVELQYNYSLSLGGVPLPGEVDLGLVYFSGGDAIGQSFPSAHGFYMQLQQLIYREANSSDSPIQGMGIFASYYPRFREARELNMGILENFVIGIVYNGLIPSRDKDVIGVGYTWAELNQFGPDNETVIELFYKVQLTESVSIQPDIQYIGTPSGIHRDALVTGVRFVVGI
jgi:porin